MRQRCIALPDCTERSRNPLSAMLEFAPIFCPLAVFHSGFSAAATLEIIRILIRLPWPRATQVERGETHGGVIMAFVTGDVVPVSGDEMPFKVVFKQGETVLTEWLVESKEDGELQIVETLKSLVDDDEDEEGDDDDDE